MKVIFIVIHLKVCLEKDHSISDTVPFYTEITLSALSLATSQNIPTMFS